MSVWNSNNSKKTCLGYNAEVADQIYYENHQTAEWIQIFISLPHTLLSTNVIKFLSHVYRS